jgi:hypothetical protein
MFFNTKIKVQYHTKYTNVYELTIMKFVHHAIMIYACKLSIAHQKLNEKHNP